MAWKEDTARVGKVYSAWYPPEDAVMLRCCVVLLATLCLGGLIGCDSSDETEVVELARSADGDITLYGTPGVVPAGVVPVVAAADPAQLPAAPGGTVPVAAVNCTPDGTAFSSPVRLDVRLDAALGGGVTLRVWRQDGTVWQRLNNRVALADGGQSISFEVDHFSTYAVFRTPGEPWATVAPIFEGGDVVVAEGSHPTWSLDGKSVVFVDGDSGLQIVDAKASAIPKALRSTGMSITTRMAPVYTNANAVTFWTGWIVTSDGGSAAQQRDMHSVTVDLTTFGLVVAGAFNGDRVGLAHDQAIAPTEIALSSDGRRGVATWFTGVWLLDLAGGACARIGDAVELRHPAISPDGSVVAYDRADGHVYTRAYGGVETGQSAGQWPSFSGDGTRVGFCREHSYVLRGLADGVEHSYALPEWLTLRDPVLSPDAVSFVYRNGTGDSGDGLSLGRLVEG